MIPKPLPRDFLSKQPIKNWHEVLFGVQKGWMGWRSCVDIANARVQQSPHEVSESLVELSLLTKESASRASELITSLLQGESPQSEIETKAKWLYILMSWLYHNREQFPDPFREIEILYAEFDYPGEIEGFVGFMPPKDSWRPAEHSREENRERMLHLWEAYLEAKYQQYLRLTSELSAPPNQ